MTATARYICDSCLTPTGQLYPEWDAEEFRNKWVCATCYFEREKA